MKMSIRPSVQLAAAVAARWGDLDREEALADLLRAEVTARGSCARWVALRRIEQAAAPFVAGRVTDRLSDLCAALEAEGDFSVSSGGILHVSPLRAIELEANQYRIVASLPTARLRSQLPGQVYTVGARRSLRFNAAERDIVAEAIRALGGMVISPEAWAGLGLTPCADARWITSLDNRLEWQPEAAGGHERDGALDWSALVLAASGPRWRRQSEDATRLWRARNHVGRWIWAWGTAGHSPARGNFVSLSADDASRTVFALARIGERPVSATLVRAGEVAHLRLSERLPRAEYRYLATVATISRVEHHFQWSMSASRVDDVLDTLGRRLGLDITEEAMA